MCVKLLLWALVQSRLQDPDGECTANWECIPSTLALGLFIYAFIYIPCGGYEFQAITVGCRKNVTFLYFSKSNLKDATLPPAELAENSALVLRILPLPHPEDWKKLSDSYQVQSWGKGSLVWGPHCHILAHVVCEPIHFLVPWWEPSTQAGKISSIWDFCALLRQCEERVPFSGHLLEAGLFSALGIILRTSCLPDETYYLFKTV